MAEDPTPEELFPEYRHGMAKVSPLLKGDRYQGSGRIGEYPKLTTHKPFTPYGSGKMEDQGIETPIQQDHEDTKGDDQ